MITGVDNKFSRANADTFAAADALVIINGSQIVADRDGAGGAVALAEHTADAANVAYLPQLGAALVRRAADGDVEGILEDRDYVAGAGGDTFAAGLT